MGSSLLISTIEACTQAENETRSDNIKWGIKQRASNGSLGFYRRKCYGYDKDKNGELVINEEQAEVVRLIFHLPEVVRFGTAQPFAGCFQMRNTKAICFYRSNSRLIF